jgi:hypothetical protein
MVAPSPRIKPLPFGKPTQVTKFGSERFRPENLPPLNIREWVMLSPEGRAHLFSSTSDQQAADTSLKPVFGKTFVEMLQLGWMSISNGSVRLPVITMLAGHDMGIRQLAAFRVVLNRYPTDLITIIVRAYSPQDKAYNNVGQFRTKIGAEMGARGG